MSSLPNQESHEQSAHEHVMAQTPAPSVSDVSASLAAFWDTVRSSAELIVTLRQEVVQLRAQNATLDSALVAANEAAQQVSASSQRIESLELQVLELTELVDQKQLQFDAELASLRSEHASQEQQNSTRLHELEGALAAAQQEAGGIAEAHAKIQELESQLQQQSEQHESTLKHYENELAERDDEAQRLKMSAEEVDKLLTDLSQARMELCEYELQVSAREAELRTVTDELAALKQQYEDLGERQAKATLADLQALNEVHEKKLSEAQLEAAEIRQTMERMKTEKSQLNDDYLMLAEKYQSIEVQVTNLQNALSSAQDALQQAHTQLPSLEQQPELAQHELDALQHRLSELELIASKAAETELQMAALQDEIENLQEQLDKALEIVEIYRAAGLRHIEDPDLRNQMSLFGMAATTDQSRQIVQDEASGKGLSPEEMEALAERLDNLASRVAQLLGIS
jgi:chromosome segregation ATPase